MKDAAEGYRGDLGAIVHDVDSRGDQHRVVFDFATRDNAIDNYRTAWAPGVFRDSFQRRPHPPMLWNHNPDTIIGSAVRCESLPDRARVVNKFADFRKVPKAEEVHSLLVDGHIPGASFHFRNGVLRPHPNVRSARRYESAEFLESSPVTFPAGKENRIVDVRSDPRARGVPIDDLTRALDILSGRRRHSHASNLREVAAILAEREVQLRSDNREQDHQSPALMVDRIDEILADLRKGRIRW